MIQRPLASCALCATAALNAPAHGQCTVQTRRHLPCHPGAMRLLPLLLFAACQAAPAALDSRLTGAGPDHELVLVPAGPGVTEPFWLGRYEVTQAQFAAFVQATGYDGSEAPSSKPSEPFLADWRDGRPPVGKDRHPACQMNWFHATAYCRWLSDRTGRTVRLPRDAEWSWAAMGTKGRRYPWGDTWDASRCNSLGDADGFAASAPVGSFPAGTTPEGIADLAGNIWEWTSERHLRGGPWCMGETQLRCDSVANEDAMRADDKFGLRLVVEVR